MAFGMLPNSFLTVALLSLSTTLFASTPPPVDVPSPHLGADGNPDPRSLQLHQYFLDRAQQGPVDLLFIGDSITEGWNYFPALWNEYYGRYPSANFGVAGDQTQHVLWRIANGELDEVHPKVVVLLIGTNNYDRTAEAIARGVTKIVTEIRSRLPETKILLLAIFPRGTNAVKNFKLRYKIWQVNRALAKLDDQKWIHYLDIGMSFLEWNGSISVDLMPDGLHPSEAGYRVWAEKMNPLLTLLMNSPEE